MNNKNIAGILEKLKSKTTNSVVIGECNIWINRIQDNNLKHEILIESKLQNDIEKDISIVHDFHKRDIEFYGIYYNYLGIKDTILVRKFIELLMNK